MLEFARRPGAPKVSLSRYEGPRLSMLLTASSVTVAAPQVPRISERVLVRKNNQTSTFSRRPPLIFWIKTGRLHTETTLRKKIFPPKGPAFTWTPISRGASFWVRSNHHPHGSTQQVTIPFMKKLSSLLLALAGSLACSGANGVPPTLSSPCPGN
ncbi:MAG: hypothetical protein ACLSUW_05485 [Akkermansia sp.]